MTFDSKTRTITLGSKSSASDVLADMGADWIHMIRRAAALPDASSSLLSDWRTIETWLGCAGRELNQNDHAKIGEAVCSYFAKGRSPSAELESVFRSYAQRLKSENRVFADPPPEVVRVFNRMHRAPFEQTKANDQRDLPRVKTDGERSKVVLYKNNKFMCCCQIKLGSGARMLISIASAPTPSIKIFKMGLFGIFPIQTIWEYNPTMAGGYEAYVRKMMMMFQDPLAKELKHPLDILRDRLLPCRSIAEVRDSLFNAERSVSK